jgi:hypothetical protein
MIASKKHYLLAKTPGDHRIVQTARKEPREKAVERTPVGRQATWKISAVTGAWVMENESDDIPANLCCASKRIAWCATSMVARRWKSAGAADKG